MDLKKIILGGTVGGVAIFILGTLFYYATQSVYAAVPADFWAPMPMPFWLVELLVANIVMGVLLAAGYAKFGNALKGNGIKKGLTFGVWFGVIFTLIFKLSSFLVYALPLTVQFVEVITWIVSIALAGAVIGWVFEKV